MAITENLQKKIVIICSHGIVTINIWLLQTTCGSPAKNVHLVPSLRSRRTRKILLSAGAVAGREGSYWMAGCSRAAIAVGIVMFLFYIDMELCLSPWGDI
jgi:hypothetical protein